MVTALSIYHHPIPSMPADQIFETVKSLTEDESSLLGLSIGSHNSIVPGQEIAKSGRLQAENPILHHLQMKRG